MNLVLENVTQHNLRLSRLEIPLHTLVGVTGPSGSGKSSLVVHTIFAESQRRYFSSLSTYQRQFFEKWARPQVEAIHNLGASLLIGQKNVIRNSRATVATTAGIYPLLCNIFAHGGTKYCPSCGHEIIVYESAALADRLSMFKDEVWLGFPLTWAVEKKVFEDELKVFIKLGLNQICLTDDLVQQIFKVRSVLDTELIKTLPGKEVVFVCDRTPGASLTVDQISEVMRLTQSWATRLSVIEPKSKSLEHFSIRESCASCGTHYGPLTPDHFSYYSSVGSCPECTGFGAKREIDLYEIAARQNSELTLEQGFFKFLELPRFRNKRNRLFQTAREKGVPLDQPWSSLTPMQQDTFLFGSGAWKGLKHLFDRLESKKYKMHVRIFLNRFYSEKECQSCKGSRLIPKSGLVKVLGKPIHEIMLFTFDELSSWVSGLSTLTIPADILEPLQKRLTQIQALGLGYLTLNRKSKTLSGGEVQRLSIVHHIGTGISDTLYVLDEPSIGLHPRDCGHLVEVCKSLVDLGNHCMVIEHDTGILAELEHVIELGPGSGKEGGLVVWEGKAREWKKQAGSHKIKSFIKSYQPRPQPHWIEITAASGHNLKEVSCKIPLGCLVGVCGISGSGKTSLILKTLVPYLEERFGKTIEERPLPFGAITVPTQGITDVEYISQDLPIRSSRANLLTYTGAFDLIRKHFSASPDAKKHKLKPGHFSFNSDLGRCPECKGMGEIIVEMIFMEDLHIPCDECAGLRFKRNVLDVRYRGKTIADILDMTVDELIEFFDADDRLKFIFTTMKSVGLGYLKSGQGCHTYSGGELQRLKIARIFLHPTRRKVLYVLDEPTTGLHAGEIKQLLFLFSQMISKGHSVLVIEHHPDVLKSCDYLIELGPEGGFKGGEIIFEGLVKDLKNFKASPTAPYL